MRHNYRIEGHAFALRPVQVSDAAFIVQLRAGDPHRVRYLHPVTKDVQLQEDWLERYFEREHDFYWVVEHLDSGSLEGLAGIYDLKPAEGIAEWGRWVVRPGSLAAVESALLIYRTAFEYLKLHTLYCLTVADNLPVVSFHDSSGLARECLLKAHFRLGDCSYDAVKHVCTAGTWPAVRDRLEPQALRISRRVKSPK